jgi:uncharacterized membrane protein
MKLRKAEVFMGVMVLLAFAIGLYVYPHVPQRVASHWNARGQVDGYMPKFGGLFLLPVVLIVIALIFAAIPRVDPLKANIEQFLKYYDGFIILFFAFMLLIYLQVVLWNIGIQISPNLVLPIGVGLLFFYVGILCEHAKMNWSIGIRTPWTLSSPRVWEKTHQVGARLFKAAGLVALLGIFFQRWAVFFILAPALLVAVYSVVYSYLAYRREIQMRDI